jgi:hypothetical protein
MPISPEDRYKQLFEHWHFASEMRFKILSAWWAVYVGLAAVFGWLWTGETFKPFRFVVPLLGLIATVLFWFMDDRNGSAIHASKEIIKKLEEEADIPCCQRIIPLSEDRGMKHATAITIFAWLMGVFLLFATVYFIILNIFACTRGPQ